MVDAPDLPQEIRDQASHGIEDSTSASGKPAEYPFVSLRELEDDYIRNVLVATGNNKTLTARILGIHPTSLTRRLKKETVAS